MYNPKQTLAEYQSYLQAEQLAPKSRETYTSMLKTYLWHFRKTADRITTKEIITYLAGIRSPVTRKQARAAIGKLYTMLGQTQKMKGVPRPKQPKSLPAFLTREQVKTLLDGTTNPKHKAILVLMYSAALRISEVLHLELSQIRQIRTNGPRGLIEIKDSKGAKDRVVPVSIEVIECLRNYIRAQGRPVRYLFEGPPGRRYSASSIRQMLTRQLRRARITTAITPHGLRHSRATHLINGNMNPHALKEFMGHYKIETTEMYLHLAVNNIADQVTMADTAMSTGY